jgi:hypothetical protein
VCWECCWQELFAHGGRTEIHLEAAHLVSVAHSRGWAVRSGLLNRINNVGCFELLSEMLRQGLNDLLLSTFI